MVTAAWKQTLPLKRSKAPSCGSRTIPQAKMAFTISLLPDRGLLLEVLFVRQFAFAKFVSKVSFRFGWFFFPFVSGFSSELAFSEAFPETSFSSETFSF